ncbi:hypothetical protein SAMN04488030_2227 [Aliiroseovarius halocynthiae]|uniref:Uncharacterized protein n=1 Tax=Aliiroseovarius halocynthiae TaxID=985055 RepID=A0A545SZT3_9RHOB|nr:hypothetical protein [Aliiroseovarius halocynthiae]TQV70473.1 hypothetical protein FIL88_00800 [Aliiroseovarius halocynthiae]SMR81805.1 hypothetical protein SAMN04488030_2227 [Aliiroseovarius halocynthiae]
MKLFAPVIIPAVAFSLVAGCDMGKPTHTPTTNVTDLPLMGGYRTPADECEKLGENELTINYLDHTADLVGCPEGYEGLGVFQVDTGGVEVARINGWVLFSIPRGT